MTEDESPREAPADEASAGGHPSPAYPEGAIPADALPPPTLDESPAGLTLPVRRKPIPPTNRNLGGRPKGSPNRIKLEVREVARNLLEDPVYLRKLKHDIRKRKVHPQMESTLWAYAFGKPVERVELGRVGDFSKLTDDELIAQFEATVQALRREGGGKLRLA